MRRTLARIALSTLLLGGTVPSTAQTGWTLDTQPATAALTFGQPQTLNAFRLDCSGGKTSLSTWTTRLPRNITEGEFPSRLSVFQGNREVVLGGTGRVLPADGTGQAVPPSGTGQAVPPSGTRVDALIADRTAFLAGMGANRRFVVVSFAGRGTAPAPTAEQLAAFGTACQTR